MLADRLRRVSPPPAVRLLALIHALVGAGLLLALIGALLLPAAAGDVLALRPPQPTLIATVVAILLALIVGVVPLSLIALAYGLWIGMLRSYQALLFVYGLAAVSMLIGMWQSTALLAIPSAIIVSVLALSLLPQVYRYFQPTAAAR